MMAAGGTKLFLPGISLAVSSCTNPGMAAALLLSIAVTMALAYVERGQSDSDTIVIEQGVQHGDTN